VDAGWITRLFASPMFARWEKRLEALDELLPRRDAALDAKPEDRAVQPAVVVLFARACVGWLGSPESWTQETLGCFSRNFPTARASRCAAPSAGGASPALQELEGVEGGQRRPEIAQQLGPAA